MAFDPFNDFEERGYLQNHAGVKDPVILKRLEHSAFSRKILKALSSLRQAQEINLDAVQQTHRTLFSDIYPWAGQDRSQNASDLAITKGDIEFQLAPYVPRGVDFALSRTGDPNTFRNDPGKVIGELAYAHPFLDGNGRTITAVASELARRSGFHIAWQETTKADYLKALTAEIDQPGKKHLTNYLRSFMREGELGVEQAARQLTELPGLSKPVIERIQDSRPTLTIIAGPNGAGKSTFTAAQSWMGSPVVDPDAIARAISPTDPAAAATQAGRQSIALRRQYLKAKRSFTVETTLSGNSTSALINEARSHGFQVVLKYIGLSSAEQAQSRVASRVATGGHDIPKEDVERRFAHSLDQLPSIMAKVDRTELIDNSGQVAFRHAAEISKEHSQFIDPPQWASQASFRAAQSELSKAEKVQELKLASEKALAAARVGGVPKDQFNGVARKLRHLKSRGFDKGGYAR